MSLDEDEIDALAQAGAVVLRWIVLALGVVLLARVLCGCGGDQFTVSVFPDAGELATADAGAGPERAAAAPAEASAHPVMTTPDAAPAPAADAGETAEAIAPAPPDASSREASTPPPHEAGPPPACEPQTCPVCMASTGYACCTAAGACGCENPSQGGACL